MIFQSVCLSPGAISQARHELTGGESIHPVSKLKLSNHIPTRMIFFLSLCRIQSSDVSLFYFISLKSHDSSGGWPLPFCVCVINLLIPQKLCVLLSNLVHIHETRAKHLQYLCILLQYLLKKLPDLVLLQTICVAIKQFLKLLSY